MVDRTYLPAVNVPRYDHALLGTTLLFCAVAVSLVPGPGLSLNVLSLGALIGLTLVIRRRSSLGAWHLLQLVLAFGAAALLGRIDAPLAMKVVIVWAMGVSAGSYLLPHRSSVNFLTRRKRTSSCSHVGLTFQWSNVVVGYILVVVQGYVYQSGSAGFAAQLQTGVSGATGWRGYVVAMAPVWVCMLLYISLATGRGVRPVICLVVIEIAASSLSGFRGAAPNLMLGIFIFCTLALPADSPWKSPKRVGATVLAAIILALGGFLVSASIKSSVAANMDLSSAGTRAPTVDLVVKRVSLVEPLQAGVLARGNLAARSALSWQNDAISLIPRAIYPEKPTLDYGQTVTETIYGSEAKSSSTITFLGDIYLQFAWIGVICGALMFGAFCAFVNRIRWRIITLPSCALLGTIAMSITNIEGQALLTAVGALRTFLLVTFGWWLLRLVTDHRRKGLATTMK